MIITVDDIRAIRPIAHNIDEERVNVFIREAEELDIIPVIGAKMFNFYNQLGAITVDEENTPLETENGEEIYSLSVGDLTADEYKFLFGGTYTNDCGKEVYFSGLKRATAYFAYARYMRSAQINCTPYGVVTKLGEESEPTDHRTIMAEAQNAQNIGEAMLGEAMRFWSSVQDVCCGHKVNPKRKFTAI